MAMTNLACLWQEMWLLGKPSDRIKIEIEPENEGLLTAGSRPRSANLAKIPQIPVGAMVRYELLLVAGQFLTLLERDGNGTVHCLSPSSEYPKFEIGEPLAREQLLALVSSREPQVSWLAAAKQDFMALDAPQLQELMNWARLEKDCAWWQREFDIVAKDPSPPQPSIHPKKTLETVKRLRIVLASPGDVQAERDMLAKDVIPELQSTIGRSKSLMLDLYRWETDAYPRFHVDGPQGAIDEILDIKNCDIFIGIFWTRFGSPIQPGETETGTEHEFNLAIAAWNSQGKPEIMLYFKEQPFLPKNRQEIDQYGKVLDFRQSFPQEGMYAKFERTEDFKDRVRQDLSKVILDFSEFS